jgi:hypothetical protein
MLARDCDGSGTLREIMPTGNLLEKKGSST